MDWKLVRIKEKIVHFKYIQDISNKFIVKILDYMWNNLNGIKSLNTISWPSQSNLSLRVLKCLCHKSAKVNMWVNVRLTFYNGSVYRVDFAFDNTFSLRYTLSWRIFRVIGDFSVKLNVWSEWNHNKNWI